MEIKRPLKILSFATFLIFYLAGIMLLLSIGKIENLIIYGAGCYISILGFLLAHLLPAKQSR
ncbi:hypothetical protein BH23BAC2_BH23BAC2_21550 [soil metagenome]